MTTYIAVGPNCWGKCFSEAGAVEHMRKHGRLRKNARVRFFVYRCHPDTRVDDIGHFMFPEEHRPELVREYVPKSDRKKDKV